MKYVFYTNIVSPHQVPWCTEFVNLVGRDSFYYVVTDREYLEREKLGWQIGHINFNVLTVDNASELLEHAAILISGVRDVALFERRAKEGLRTFYVSERWFKPPLGMMRLFIPSYWLMCYRFVHLLTRKVGNEKALMLLPIGIHAARDMAKMIGLFSADMRYIWKMPEIEMANRGPLSPFKLKERTNNKAETGIDRWPKDKVEHSVDRMRLWGYFVEPTRNSKHRREEAGQDIQPGQSEKGDSIHRPVRILWVGRMLEWKRVDTLVQAVVKLLDEGAFFALKIVGHGPMESKLRQLAGRWLVEDAQLADDSKCKELYIANSVSVEKAGRGITFHSPVPISEVRTLMREADVYVLPSDGGEGWGAVVNEAMAERCCVIGTYEAGSSATMIEDGVNGLLFHAGDTQELIECLKKVTVDISRFRDIGCGTPLSAGTQEEDVTNKLYHLYLHEGMVSQIRKQAKRTMDESWNPEIAARTLFDFVTHVGN